MPGDLVLDLPGETLGGVELFSQALNTVWAAVWNIVSRS